MAKYNISEILAMESAKITDSKAIKKLHLKQKKNYSIAREGLFDFFRKKKGEEVKKKSTDPKVHQADLEQANKVSIHLMTATVDDEIKYLEELLNEGLPFLSKDIDRTLKSFKFIIDNHRDILNKIDKLVDVSYPDPRYKLNENKSAVEFDTFYITLSGMAKDKEHQAFIGNGWDYEDVEDYFDSELTDEDIEKYAKLYCLNEAIPTLDFIYPKKRAAKEQPRVYLEKGDQKLEKLIKLNMNIIENSRKIFSHDDLDKAYELATRADKLTHPVGIGDGDEFGMLSLMSHSLGYQYDLTDGFADDFIKNYTAH